MRLPKLSPRREGSDPDESPVATDEQSAVPAGYRSIQMPETTPPPLTSALTKSIRFTVSEPQGYYFDQVETFVQQVVEALTFYEDAEFQWRQSAYEMQVEADQQAYDNQRLRSEIELFKVQGSPLVNPDGSYMTESQQAQNDAIAAELAHAHEMLAQAQQEAERLFGVASQAEADLVSQRQWADQLGSEVQSLRAQLAHLEAENAGLVSLNSTLSSQIDAANAAEADAGSVAAEPIEVVPVLADTPPVEVSEVVDLQESELGLVEGPDLEATQEGQIAAAPLVANDLVDPDLDSHNTAYDDSQGHDLVEAEAVPLVVAVEGLVPGYEDDLSVEGADEIVVYETASDEPGDVAAQPFVVEAPIDTGADAPVPSHDAAADEALAGEALDDEYEDEFEDDEFEDEDDEFEDEDDDDPYAEYDAEGTEDLVPALAVVPIDSELPEGTQAPGTGEAAKTYPPAAPDIPLSTRGFPVEVWAPELHPDIRKALDKEAAAKNTAAEATDTHPDAHPDTDLIPEAEPTGTASDVTEQTNDA